MHLPENEPRWRWIESRQDSIKGNIMREGGGHCTVYDGVNTGLLE